MLFTFSHHFKTDYSNQDFSVWMGDTCTPKRVMWGSFKGRRPVGL